MLSSSLTERNPLSPSREFHGQCLCQSVSLKFSSTKESFDACHCGICRKWTGGPFLTVESGHDLSWEGEPFIATYNSSDWAERGFCRQCGTHLFYRLKTGKLCAVPLGLLKNVDDLKFETQIFIDMKTKQYSFANKTECMTEAEVFAKFM